MINSAWDTFVVIVTYGIAGVLGVTLVILVAFIVIDIICRLGKL